MIYYGYCYYNKLNGTYGDIRFENFSPEQAKDFYVQGLIYCDDKQLALLNECDVYFIGSFDNISGEFVSNKDFLISLSPECTRLLKLHEKA